MILFGGKTDRHTPFRGFTATPSHSLMNLNDNVLVNVLSYLSFHELNEFDMCSRRCREIRSHESLDQTRVGTIVFTENSTRDSFYN